jgi:hypothetical protein
VPYHPDITDTHAEQADLETLAGHLTTHSCKTVLVTRNGRLPHLDVVNTQAPALSERIYAQAGMFWWPWAQVIAPTTHPAAAARAIAQALAISPATQE